MKTAILAPKMRSDNSILKNIRSLNEKCRQTTSAARLEIYIRQAQPWIDEANNRGLIYVFDFRINEDV